MIFHQNVTTTSANLLVQCLRMSQEWIFPFSVIQVSTGPVDLHWYTLSHTHQPIYCGQSLRWASYDAPFDKRYWRRITFRHFPVAVPGDPVDISSPPHTTPPPPPIALTTPPTPPPPPPRRLTKLSFANYMSGFLDLRI